MKTLIHFLTVALVVAVLIAMPIYTFLSHVFADVGKLLAGVA